MSYFLMHTPSECYSMLYHCFVYHCLNYGTEVWATSYKIYKQTLVNWQRKVLRIITNSSWNACVDQLFKTKNHGDKKDQCLKWNMTFVRQYSAICFVKTRACSATILERLINSIHLFLNAITCKRSMFQKSMYMELFKSVRRLWLMFRLIQNRYA